MITVNNFCKGKTLQSVGFYSPVAGFAEILYWNFSLSSVQWSEFLVLGCERGADLAEFPVLLVFLKFIEKQDSCQQHVF